MSEEYTKRISECHARSADRILHGCLRNGGLYIKLGQGLVAMNHILPKQYLQTLEVLHDKALHRKPDEVCINEMLEVLHDKALKHGKPNEVCKQDPRGATR